MAQGILLVGGLGTRLLPLTRTVPKPMLPIAGLPITEHQLMMARRANITSIVLATSYLAEVFVPYFGDGSKWGIDLQYAVETSPLGTGGAIRNAAQLLDGDQSIIIMNGDVLSSHDLVRQISMHESENADVTLHLTHVDDARAFGCVPTDEQNRVLAFLEKMDNPVTNNINAGCYVFHPRVLNSIAANTVVSIEREIFPQLVASGKKVLGFGDDSFWLDVGKPTALLQGSIAIVEGRANGQALDRVALAHRSREYVALEGAHISPSAHISGGSAIGRHARVGAGAKINGSIIGDGAIISDGAQLTRCFVADGVQVEGAEKLHDCFVGIEGIQPLLLEK
ncbi:MAG: NDP-sugar synthase [Actinobacteria bacterium]|nr:NDP-sugar synthase [Actinomycetota bacterium]